jgi:multidrug efflux pump subunit AcrA (membrane-fusion protein)
MTRVISAEISCFPNWCTRAILQPIIHVSGPTKSIESRSREQSCDEQIGLHLSDREINIVSQISKTMISVDFEENTLVEEGQALFQIRDWQYSANIKAAEADLDHHRTQLAIDQIQLEHSKSLMDKDNISKQEFASPA